MRTASTRTDTNSTRAIPRGVSLLDRHCRGMVYLCGAVALGDAVSGFYALGAWTALASGTHFLIRLLNSRGYHKLAASTLIVLGNLSVFAYASYLGKHALVQNIFFPLVGLPVIFWEEIGTLFTSVGVVLPLFLYALLEVRGYAPLSGNTYVGDPAWVPTVSVASCFATCFLIMGEFFRSARHAELSLREEQKKLLTASKLSALGEMAGGIAHEINNPLSSILLLTSQIRIFSRQAGPAEAPLGELASKLQETVSRVTSIVRSLSSFARNAERDPPKAVKLAKFVNETCAMCSAKFSAANIKLRVSVESDDTIFHCNSVEISQVLVNLLNNACDAAQSGPERWVEVQASRAGGRIEIAVTDSGPGIPLSARARLFEPFFTTKEAGRGTGLGLSISANIARAHHGELFLDEKSARTCFRLRLPMLGATPPPCPPGGTQSRARATAGTHPLRLG